MFSIYRRKFKRKLLFFFERVIIFGIRILNKKGNYFITYHKRPKFITDISFFNNNFIKSYNSYAIVMQGPVITDDNFTIETLKIYKRNFTNAKIIVSSWDDTPQKIIDQIRSLNVTFISNKKPEIPGNQNINLQITSTNNGLIEAADQGAIFTTKTRTDQRIYHPYFLDAVSLLKDHQIDKKTYGIENKIIITSMSTIKYRPYGASDMFMLGYTKDLILYWNSDLDMRTLKISTENLTVKKYAQYEYAETYILANFLKRQDVTLNFTITQTWEIYSDLFVILDRSTIDIFWYKYQKEKENRLDFYNEHIYKEVTFLESILLNKEIKSNEEYQNKEIGKYNP